MRKIKKTIVLIISAILVCCMIDTSSVKASTANQVLKGKDGWLFYKNESDGTSIPEYKGNNHYSKAAMKNIKDNLLAMKKAVEKKGAAFIVCIIPNKEVMYPEYMPDSIKRKSTTTRADQLSRYLEKNSNLRIVYPKQELIDAKQKHQVYYQTDTHWNSKGRFIGVQMLRREILGKSTSIDEIKFRILKRDHSGDLAKLLGQSSKYCTDIQYTPVLKVKKQDRSKKNILIVGDSFGHEMVGQADKYFGKVSYSGVWEYSMRKINKNTDIVVWEGAERYLDRFGSIKLYNK